MSLAIISNLVILLLLIVFNSDEIIVVVSIIINTKIILNLQLKYCSLYCLTCLIINVS